jgi:hypothetical protein
LTDEGDLVKFSKSRLKWAAATAGLAMVASLPAGLATAQPKPHLGPTIKLVVAQKHIEATRSGKFVFVNPGVYVAAFGSKLEFDVQRASYAKPLTITEIINRPGGGEIRRPLPAWVIAGWSGLARFVRVTVTTSHGKLVTSQIFPFCPDGNPQRTNPNSPSGSPFPQGCPFNPFTLGNVLGLQRGWAADPVGPFYGGLGVKAGLGYYKVTVNIVRGWRKILGVSPADGTAVVHLHVVKSGSNGSCPPFCGARPAKKQNKALPTLPAVAIMNSPPKADLPDLSPLPSWGINVINFKAKHHPAQAFLDFGATVWVGGNARLDVEGFRHNGSPTMLAYQYFWHNGRVVGRARAGTMGFDNGRNENEWHFQQFAKYRLLNVHKSAVLTSGKVGFCIAPTDPVNLVLPHADWQPSFTGLFGACGSPTSLWVQEMLPVGWGDTYFQFFSDQSFDVTHLRNGTYYIEIIANPEHLLHETNTHNDISLRRVILGGTPGHRTVRVPAVNGIDQER